MYGRGGDLITSGAGAMGLMQVMPATYDELRRRYSELGSDPFNPHDNIMAGTAYIREMYDIYGSPGFLAAYNAGPGRMDDYLTRNRTLPEETRRYVANIGPRIAGNEPRRASPGAQYAANGLPATVAPAAPYSAPAPIRLAQQTAPVAAPQPTPQPAPVQVAALETTVAGSFIVLRPQPSEEAPPPAPAPEPTRFAALPPIELAPPPPPVLQQFATIPEPPRPPPALREPPRTQQQLAAAALVPVAPRGSSFSLISRANAEPIGVRHAGFTSGHWAVQVGAFATEGLAGSTARTAREQARDVLGGAQPVVIAVRQPRGFLYRARLMGLSRDSAAQACERLARTHTTCMVVSPDAQS